MATSDTHIIHKVFVEVETNSFTKANDIRINANDFVNNHVLEYIEKYIASIEQKWKDQHVRIDHLEISLDDITGDYAALDIQTSIEHQIDKQLQELTSEDIQPVENERKPKSEAEILNSGEHAFKSLIHFLKTGKIPWWVPSAKAMRALLEKKRILQVIEQHQTEFISVFKSLKEQQSFVNRWIQQMSPEVIFYAFKIMKSPTANNGYQPVLKAHARQIEFIKQQTTRWQMQFWRSVAPYIFNPDTVQEEEIVKPLITDKKLTKKERESLVESISALLNLDEAKLQKAIEEINLTQKTDQSVDSEIDKKTTSETQENQESTEGYSGDLAENAGLILLHPFLKPFFTKLELLDKNQRITNPALAAHILHYLATGEEKDYEFAMTFERYLCDIPADEVLPKEIELSNEIKEHCEELLSAVLEHWTALKSGSHTLLRHEFLTREGKILSKETPQRIIVERKTIDILLDKLPWNLSIVRLPWRSELLYIEW